MLRNLVFFYVWDFLGSSAAKESACNAGDLGSIPGLGRSPGEGKGYPLQYAGLENSMKCTVHGVMKSRTWLSHSHFTVALTLWMYHTFSTSESLCCLLGVQNCFFSLWWLISIYPPGLDKSLLLTEALPNLWDKFKSVHSARVQRRP